MSLFEEIDGETNQNKYFWTDADLLVNNLNDPIQFQSEVLLKSDSDMHKARLLILASTTIYLCDKTKLNIKKKSVVLWKTVSAYEEQYSKSSNCNNFVLRIGTKISQEFVVESPDVLDSWLYYLGKVSIMRDFEADFVIVRELGYGNYANVFLASEVLGSSEYAIKVIDKEKILTCSRGVESIINEIQIMRQLDHQALLKLHGVYESNEEVIMVLDYMAGGNLNQRLISLSRISESKAQNIIKTLLEACKYMHSLNIVHRDIKLDNILLTSLNELDDIKLADFGLSCYLSEITTLRCGSPGYIAPEILSDNVYNNKCDLYSIGIILYILICGHSPFLGDSVSAILKKNRLGEIYFSKNEWEGISKECIDLIISLTRSNPDTRPSASEALEHNWFSHAHKTKLSISNNPLLSKFNFGSSNKKISSRLMERLEQRQSRNQSNNGQQIKILNEQASKVAGKLKNLEI